MKIYVLGSLNIDYVYQVEHMVQGGETLSSASLQQYPGGKGLNQAVALAKAGADMSFGGITGKEGGFLLDFLSQNGVNTAAIKQLEQPSGHAIIQVDRKGQNGILLFPGTNYMIGREYIEDFMKDAQPGDILLLQNEISGLPQAFEIAAKKGLQIAFNPSPYHDSIRELPLQQVKWWFCNEIEGAALFGGDKQTIAQNFQKQYPHSNLILTLGQDGSLFQNAHIQHRQPIYPVPVVDTTGAGDTFTGYFLAAVAAGEEMAKAMDMASRASAITVSRPGAASAIPNRCELVEAM